MSLIERNKFEEKEKTISGHNPLEGRAILK